MNDDFITHIERFIDSEELICRGDRILMSLSAGKDSMALLHVMISLRDKLKLKLGAFHLNHMAREDESDRDEEFIRELAEKNTVELFVERYDFNSSAEKGSFEERARVKRYEMLERISQKKSFSKILTAHNLNDNVETILMRILSGTGIFGISGIPVKRGNIVRPLICVGQDEIYSFLKRNGICWREDSSNRNTDILRNFVRHELLGLITSRFPDAIGSINHLGEVAREHLSLQESMLRKAYGEVIERSEDEVLVDISGLRHDMRLIKYVVARIMGEVFHKFVARGILKEVEKRLSNDRTHQLVYENSEIIIKKSVAMDRPVLVFSRKKINDTNNKGDWSYSVELNDNCSATVNIEETGETIRVLRVTYRDFKNNPHTDDCVFIEIHDDIKYLIVRNRRKGDRIRTDGGLKKLKDLFIENKLGPDDKQNIPLIIVDSEMAAVMMGVVKGKKNRVGCDFYVNSSSKKILAICVIGN